MQRDGLRNLEVLKLFVEMQSVIERAQHVVGACPWLRDAYDATAEDAGTGRCKAGWAVL